ncbi:hypothetical protein [Paenibacillus turpanensis]|uniref:hypothetical protein n=1 Tax=Paenibacillus turpanensis TaxID=2689078 RepID=UPI0014085972|nr:hypothetical protein [Paenibacillus turpanensis]
MPISVTGALIVVLIFIGFYVLVAWGILYFIHKRTTNPSRRSAQFLFAIVIIVAVLLIYNGLLDTWFILLTLPLCILCGKYIRQNK